MAGALIGPGGFGLVAGLDTVEALAPELMIYARARDEAHGAELQAAGAQVVVPELVPTGLQIAGAILDSPIRPNQDSEGTR